VLTLRTGPLQRRRLALKLATNQSGTRSMEETVRQASIVTLLLVVFLQGPAHAVCAAIPWRIPYWGSNTNTTLEVSSGEPCELNGNTGGANIIESLAITSRPSNGTATIGQDNGIWYQSQSGFTGRDGFAFTVTGSGPGGSGSSTVQVAVMVR
jgi:hypothetical protein